MAIQMGLDIHRDQITYELLDTDSGEIRRGRVAPGTRAGIRRLIATLPPGEVDVALEATTGWRFVVEELEAAGMRAHLAEPAETRALRGPKRRAKTDRADARHLRELLGQGRIPEAWIPPAAIQDLRTRVRLRQALVAERTAWQQRVHATLFHHGRPRPADALRALAHPDLPAAANDALAVAADMIDHLGALLGPIDAELRRFARAHPACRALMRQYGVGEIISCALLAELGDTRRFSSSRHAVRFAGLDVTVRCSDTRRAPGRLSRQGAPLLRWAAYEAAQSAARAGSPDRPTTRPSSRGSAARGPSSPWRARSCAAPTTCCASWARTSWPRRLRPDSPGLSARPVPDQRDQPRPAPERLLRIRLMPARH